jgi:predicted peptidase
MLRRFFVRVAMALVVATVAAPRLAGAQDVETGFLERSIQVEGSEFRYELYVPANYETGRAWPVILALPGSRGGSGLRQVVDKFRAIVLFPATRRSWHGRGGRAAMAALDSVLVEYNTDPGRVFLTGQSRGGNGAWFLAYTHPDRFAALVVVCGWVSSGPSGRRSAVGPADQATKPFDAVAARLAHMPVWVFHGENDDVIPVEESRRMVAALQEQNAEVYYTEFTGVGHPSWDLAYSFDGLPAWLMEHRRR